VETDESAASKSKRDGLNCDVTQRALNQSSSRIAGRFLPAGGKNLLSTSTPRSEFRCSSLPSFLVAVITCVFPLSVLLLLWTSYRHGFTESDPESSQAEDCFGVCSARRLSVDFPAVASKGCCCSVCAPVSCVVLRADWTFVVLQDRFHHRRLMWRALSRREVRALARSDQTMNLMIRIGRGE